MKCYIHDKPLIRSNTKYGGRWQCQENGCSVACWEGSTSTPADQSTRDARHACHQAFDPLWKRKSVFKSRGSAYRWLGEVMKLDVVNAHIGMFSLEQCELLLGLIYELTREIPA